MSRVLKVEIMYKRAEPITVRGRGGQANYRGEVFTVASDQQVLRGMERKLSYFVMGLSLVVNVRGYFECAPGAYFAGPVMPTI